MKFSEKLEFSSDDPRIALTQATILAHAATCGFNGELFGIRMAAEEALMNAIKHGNGSDPGKTVKITYEVTSERVEVRIEDEGSGFNPVDVPDPTSPENLGRSCGRGLMLMRYYMSEVWHGGRGNIVNLIKMKGHKPGGEGDEKSSV